MRFSTFLESKKLNNEIIAFSSLFDTWMQFIIIDNEKIFLNQIILENIESLLTPYILFRIKRKRRTRKIDACQSNCGMVSEIPNNGFKNSVLGHITLRITNCLLARYPTLFLWRNLLLHNWTCLLNTLNYWSLYVQFLLFWIHRHFYPRRATIINYGLMRCIV